MTRTEHLLTILAEECNEVAQRATKALRFGLDEVQPGQLLTSYTNAQRIMHEYADLMVWSACSTWKRRCRGFRTWKNGCMRSGSR